mgnify:CR=1 FL=1
MKKQYSLLISAFFDIMLQQKVRQVGLSETLDASLSFIARFLRLSLLYVVCLKFMWLAKTKK